MKTFMSDIDYTLEPDEITEDDARNLVMEAQRQIEDEDEKERRRKERAAAISRSQSSQASLAQAMRNRSGWDGQDTDMAGGFGLMPGSESYETYVRKRMGMDSFELERANLSEIGFGTKEDLEDPGFDEHYAEYSDKVSHQDDVRIEAELTSDGRRYIGRDQLRNRRMIKASEVDDIISFARSRAASTSTPLDDTFAEDVPEILDRVVYDDGDVSVDDDRQHVEMILEELGR